MPSDLPLPSSELKFSTDNARVRLEYIRVVVSLLNAALDPVDLRVFLA